ncbi:THO complex subunit 2 [Maudiozyma exigua]|uniref:THO complex subunit 2 n=1 Tax=Maudiozyma exigua TaxID=34358 RepID=A0A9P7BB71_MAUEX|nr:THO complex subunit 2 [Kazachstania exigua]
MSIRNGIEFMKHVSNVYPVVDEQVKILIAALENNLVDEEREDIKLPTNALIGHLKARLRKESIQLWEFCELNQSEKEARDKRVAEQKEIDEYLQILDNEKKEADIRKKLEMNKRKREAEAEAESRTFNFKESRTSEKLADNYEDFNTNVDESEWPLGRVFRTMGDTIYHLNMNNIKEAANCIKDEILSKQILDASRADMPLETLRKTVYDVSTQFFKSLVRHTNNSDFQVGLRRLEDACQSLTKDLSEDIADMYGEDTIKPPTRYSNTKPVLSTTKSTTSQLPNKPSGESYPSTRSDTRTIGRNNTRFNRNTDNTRNYDNSNDNNNKKYYLQRHSDQFSNKQKGYNRNNEVQDNSSRGIKRSLPTGSEMSSTNKMVKTETGNFKKSTRYNNKPQDDQYTQKDNRGQNNDRYGYKNQQYNKNKSNNNGPKRYNNGSKSGLPQGPRSQFSSNSRYQK